MDDCELLQICKPVWLPIVRSNHLTLEQGRAVSETLLSFASDGSKDRLCQKPTFGDQLSGRMDDQERLGRAGSPSVTQNNQRAASASRTLARAAASGAASPIKAQAPLIAKAQ